MNELLYEKSVTFQEEPEKEWPNREQREAAGRQTRRPHHGPLGLWLWHCLSWPPVAECSFISLAFFGKYSHCNAAVTPGDMALLVGSFSLGEEDQDYCKYHGPKKKKTRLLCGFFFFLLFQVWLLVTFWHLRRTLFWTLWVSHGHRVSVLLSHVLVVLLYSLFLATVTTNQPPTPKRGRSLFCILLCVREGKQKHWACLTLPVTVFE